jgi:hypothetical protein
MMSFEKANFYPAKQTEIMGYFTIPTLFLLVAKFSGRNMRYPNGFAFGLLNWRGFEPLFAIATFAASHHFSKPILC